MASKKKSASRTSRTTSKGRTNVSSNRNTKPASTTEAVLRHFQKRKSLTSKQANQMFGTERLRDIVYALRSRGFKITSIETVGKNSIGNNARLTKYVMA
jgi:hypothetical protein